MRKAVFGAMIAAAILTGCATLHATGTRSREAMLIDAGFSVEADDTSPAIAADVRTPPVRRVRREMRDGTAVYVYRDPERCHCIYVGGEPEYQELQRRLLEQYVSDD